MIIDFGFKSLLRIAVTCSFHGVRLLLITYDIKMIITFYFPGVFMAKKMTELLSNVNFFSADGIITDRNNRNWTIKTLYCPFIISLLVLTRLFC